MPCYLEKMSCTKAFVVGSSGSHAATGHQDLRERYTKGGDSVANPTTEV